MTTTKMKANSLIAYGIEGDVLSWTVKGHETLTLDLNKVAADNQKRMMIYGAKQRIVDAAAVSADPTTGKVDPAAKHAAMQRLVEHYASGAEDWSPARVGSTGPSLDPTIIAALVEVTGKDDAAIRVMVAAGATKNEVTPKAYLASISTTARVASVVNRMRTEQAEAIGVDGNAELDALMAE